MNRTSTRSSGSGLEGTVRFAMSLAVLAVFTQQYPILVAIWVAGVMLAVHLAAVHLAGWLIDPVLLLVVALALTIGMLNLCARTQAKKLR